MHVFPKIFDNCHVNTLRPHINFLFQANELLKTVNDAGVALGVAPESEGESSTLRSALHVLHSFPPYYA